MCAAGRAPSGSFVISSSGLANCLARAGTGDEHHRLVSVLYHALQAAETYEWCIEDARRAGDEELARYFQDTQAENACRAERAKALSSARLR